ncbi:hypothetical protein Glove_37g126 [Diversispora epigaea]|uniref:Uncharacterized protein n=1 Tax=Diversispora epigaea TaxID=1348612 RepID=A0A397JKF8_9GLOM|nr:hypothetical protein Glove_37g126 [Diversispora epigaea]
MDQVISYLIPRKAKTKRKWKEDYERRKLEIEAEMKFKKKLKEVTFRGDVGVREEYIVYEVRV